MKFLKRLRTYLIGVLLGVILVILFFKDRVSVLTSWLPANRVKIELVEANLTIDSLVKAQTACLNWTTEDWKRQFLNCDVNFSDSEVQQQPRRYILEFENDTLLKLEVSIQDTTAVVLKGALVKGICGN